MSGPQRAQPIADDLAQARMEYLALVEHMRSPDAPTWDEIDLILMRAGKDWSVVHELIVKKRLLETYYEGRKFYMRRLGEQHRQ